MLAIFVYTCLPFLKYAFLTIDRHYFGIVTEKLPPLVLGTTQLRYHQQHGIPHRTIEDIHYGKALANERKRKGLPMIWDE